jgi:hypothetical protein
MLYPNILLSDVSDKFYYYEFKSKKNLYNGSFIEIENNKLFARVKVDKLSSIPFYYLVYKNKLYGSTKLLDLFYELKKLKCKLELDPVAISGFIKNNSFLLNLTYFKNVFRVPAGNELYFDCVKKELRIKEHYNFDPKVELSNKLNDNEVIEKYYHLLNNAVNGYIEENNFKNIGLSLTGGFDSRMLLGNLLNNRKNIYVSHYGSDLSADFKITKKIISKYKLKNNLIEWKNADCYKNNYEKIFALTDYMLPLHHGHLFESSVQFKNQGIQTVFYGHFMDMHMQSHYYKKNFENINSNTEIKKNLFNMWVLKKSAFSIIDMNFFQKIIKEKTVNDYGEYINFMINKFSKFTSDKQYEMHYLLNHGARRAITQCQLGSHHLDYYIPALNLEFFEFVWSLKTNIKKYRLLQNKVFNQKLKEFTKIDFVLDNYKIVNISNNRQVDSIYNKLKFFLKHPKFNPINPFYDFWGDGLDKFDNFKKWMIDEIIKDNTVFDLSFINGKNLKDSLTSKNLLFDISFCSTIFTISKFLKSVFYK